MTTNKLARLYGHLTPRERLPLLISAAVRGDDAECSRLVHSAPRVGYRLPDYFGLLDSFLTVAFSHLIERLDLAARCWLIVGVSEIQAATETPRKRARVTRLDLGVATMALRFCVEVDGWKLFCSELDLDPDAFLATLPAFETVREIEPLARALANTPEEANAYLRSKRGSEPARLPTVEDVAECLRERLRMGERPWQ
jgi:hypothetical protein